MCHDKDSELRHSSIIHKEHEPDKIDMLIQQIEELKKRVKELEDKTKESKKRVRELEDKMDLIESHSNLLMDSEERYYNSLGEDE